VRQPTCLSILHWRVTTCFRSPKQKWQKCSKSANPPEENSAHNSLK